MSTRLSPFLDRVKNLTSRPCLILDGGMGTSLNKLGLNEYDAWSAPRRIKEEYICDCVKQVHLDFLESGVDILTTNTYDSNFEVKENLPSNGNEWAIDNINLAKETIDEFMERYPNDTNKLRPILAMSVGSFATTISGRAETANREQDEGDDDGRIPGYGVDAADIRSYFGARLSDDLLYHAAKCEVLVIAFETVGDSIEVQVICDTLTAKAKILAETCLSTWVTLTCLTENTVDTGGSFASCIEVLARCPQVTGVGINCTEPHLVPSLLAKIKEVFKECSVSEKLIVVYPNSGERYISRKLKDGETENWKRSLLCVERSFADAAMEWIEGGANIVGGCCRITAEDIAKLSKKLDGKVWLEIKDPRVW